MTISENVYLLRPAQVLLDTCLGLKPGENLLVLTDSETHRYGEVFSLVAQTMGANVSHLNMVTPRHAHGQELPPIVAAAMAAADAILAPTTFSVNHTNARSAASAAGARLVFMPGVHDNVFRDGSLEIDFMERKSTIEKIGRIMKAAEVYRAQSNNAPDCELTASIRNHTPVEQSGIVHEPGKISPPPSIEIATAPDKGTLTGVMYVDGAVCPGGPVKEPFRVRFEGGRIADIEQTEDGKRLSKTLDSYDDPNMYVAVELGMGMNPNAQIGRAGDCEDEAVLGTMHVGIGEGQTFGSENRAKAHVDLVMLDAAVRLDDRIVLDGNETHV